MSYEEFCKEYYPRTVRQYEMYQAAQEKLIGKVLIAVTSWYDCGQEGGTVVKVTDVSNTLIQLIPYNEGEMIKRTNEFGYQVERNQIYFDFRLATPEEIQKIDAEEEVRLAKLANKKEIEEKNERALYEKLKEKYGSS